MVSRERDRVVGGADDKQDGGGKKSASGATN